MHSSSTRKVAELLKSIQATRNHDAPADYARTANLWAELAEVAQKMAQVNADLHEHERRAWLQSDEYAEYLRMEGAEEYPRRRMRNNPD